MMDLSCITYTLACFASLIGSFHEIFIILTIIIGRKQFIELKFIAIVIMVDIGIIHDNLLIQILLAIIFI